MIPARKSEIKDEIKRFYVMAPVTIKLALEKEAFRRGTDLWSLGGQVLQSWLAAGAPDEITPREAAE